MGQVLSMIWRWVCRPKLKRRSKRRVECEYDGVNNVEQLDNDHLTIFPINEQHVGSNDGCFINIVDPPLISTQQGEEVVVVVNLEEDVRGKEIDNDKVVQLVAETTAISSSLKLIRKVHIGAYNSTQRILLVGEGDFSFSASLAIAFGSASNVVATSINSPVLRADFLIENYGNFPANRESLETRGALVLHWVDAFRMAKHPRLATMKFDRIVFNFPHAGIKKDGGSLKIRTHQRLVRGFLRNAKEMIEEDGQIHVTHKSTPYFQKWDIPGLGWDEWLDLIQEAKFKLSKYPGYRTKYGFGGDRDFDCHPSRTYKFALTSNE